MKLSERLALIRAGYSKDEIKAMIDEDAAEPVREEPAEAVDQSTMKVLSALANEVKDLKTAMYKENISNTEASTGGVLKAEDILASLLNPPEDMKGEK